MRTIRIPTPLRPYTSAQKEIEARGETVGAALEDQVRRHPALKPYLDDPNGRPRRYINLFLNGEDVRQLQGETTALQEQDRLVVIPSIAGGSDGSAGPQPIDRAGFRLHAAQVIGPHRRRFRLSGPAGDDDVPWDHGGDAGQRSRLRYACQRSAPSLLGESGPPWRL
jgi:molybdopterin converting factor small subunit